MLSIDGEIVLGWTRQDRADDKSALVQVMAWCRKSTSRFTCAYVEQNLCPHMTSLGHHELIFSLRQKWVNKLTIIHSDNGLSPDRRPDIIWTNTGILLIGPLGTNFSGILIEIHIFSFKKMRLKMPSGKWRPFHLGLKVLCNSHVSQLFSPTGEQSDKRILTHTL